MNSALYVDQQHGQQFKFVWLENVEKRVSKSAESRMHVYQNQDI
jgi:hypothetical protein